MQTAYLNLLGELMLAKKVLFLVYLDFEEYYLEMGGRYLIKYLFGGLLCYGNRDPLIREQIAFHVSGGTGAESACGRYKTR